MADEYTISGKLVLDVSDAEKKIQDVAKETQKVEKQTAGSTDKIGTDWKKVGSDMEKIGGKLTKAITLPLVALGGASVKLASDLFETVQKTEAVFASNSSRVEQWGNTAAANFGLAKQSALDAASTFGDMATSMGFSRGAAADMSMGLVELGADLASFKNISSDQSMKALEGIFTGQSQSLTRLGIVMSEANLEAFALAEGVGKTYRTMNQAEKVQLRYNYVMKATSNAHGDYARNADSVANRTRTVGERIKETGAAFGQVLTPMISGALGSINSFLTGIMNMDEEQKRLIVTIAGVAAAIPIVVLAIGKAITAYTALQTAITGVGLSMGGVVGIVGAVVGGVALLVTAFSGLSKQSSHTQEDVDATIESLLAMPDKVETEIVADTDNANTNLQNSKDKIDDIDGSNPNTKVSANTAAANTDLDTTQGKIDTLDGSEPEVPVSVIRAPDKFDLDSIKTELENLPTDIKINIETDTKLPSEAVSALAGLFSTEGTLRQNVKSTKADIDGITTGLKEAMDKLAEMQVAQVWNDVITGVISAEEGYARISAITGQVDTEKGKVDQAEKDVNKILSKISRDGKISLEEFVALSEQYKSTGTDIETKTKTTQDTVGTAMTNIVANEEAAMGATAQTEASVQEGLSSMATDADTYLGEANSIWEEHVKKIDAVKPALEEEVKASGERVEKTTEHANDMVMAHEQYYLARSEMGMTQNDAFALIEAAHGSAVLEQLKTDLGNKESETEGSYGMLLAYQLQYDEAVKTETDRHNGLIKGIDEEEAARKQTIESETYEKLKGLQLGYTDEQLRGLQSYAEKEGIEYDTASVNNARIVSEMHSTIQEDTSGSLATLAGVYDSGLTDINKTIIELGKEQVKNTEIIGEEGIAGIETGLIKNEGSLYATMRRIVKQMIAEGQKAQDSKSPSRKTAKLLGLPFIQGIGVGFEEGLAEATKKIKVGTAKLIGGASVAVSTVPQTVKAASARVDTVRSNPATITQNNTFTSKELSPYEQRLQLKRLDNDLAEVFA